MVHSDVEGAATDGSVNDPWQPIETAPKDGTVIMLYSKRDGVATGAWCSEVREDWQQIDATTKKLNGVEDLSQWHGTAANGVCIWSGHITHWMPLPPAPRSGDRTSASAHATLNEPNLPSLKSDSETEGRNG